MGPPSKDGAPSWGVAKDGDIASAATPGDLAPASGGMPLLRMARNSNDAVHMPVPQAKVDEGSPRG